MKKPVDNIWELIGETPILHAVRLEKKFSTKGNIFAKLELFNPAGSIKDRVALNMFLDAEEKGLIKKGSVIIEPTSGNTGIGLASIAAAKGYRSIFVMPETMSIERRKLLSAYGAEIVLVKGGMSLAIEKAQELCQSIEGGFIPSQFDNTANPQAHIKTTGPEIWEQMQGKVDVLVAGIGTGGTITGTGKFLKEKNPQIEVVGIEPYSSPFLTKGEVGGHKIQGIGAGFKPSILQDVYDKIIPVKDEDAMEIGREIAKTEGVLVGISSGGAMWAAIELAKTHEYKDKNIVVILPDTGERYLSSEMF